MKNLDEREYNNVYAIPANYTDSGKLLGGMIDTRNAIETVILVLALGYPELILIPMPGTIRIVVMTVTLLPLAVVSAMGVDGGSLFQYIGHIIHFWTHRRKLHFRRIGYRYGQSKRKRNRRKEKLEFVQDYLPIRDLKNGIIETTDNRYIKSLRSSRSISRCNPMRSSSTSSPALPAG